MTTRAEFKNMTMDEMKAHVEEAERQVNLMHQHVVDYAQENNLSPQVMAAGLMAMIGRMITTTVGDDVEKQDQYLEHIKEGIKISIAENGLRPFDEGAVVPPWLRN